MHETDDLVFLAVGGRFAEAGAEFAIVDKWHELQSYYVVLEDVVGGGRSDMELGAVFESDGKQYVLICQPPNMIGDEDNVHYTLTQALTNERLLLLDGKTAKRMSERCDEALSAETGERIKELERFFGAFREWEG